MSSSQIDYGRGLMGCLLCCCRCCFNTHADTTTFTGTKHLHLLEVLHRLRNVYQDITALLHDVLIVHQCLFCFCLIEIALTGTIDLLYSIHGIFISRAEVHEGIVHRRLAIA